MKKLLLLICSFCAFLNLTAQNNGNEWIHYDQTYYSFDVYRTGLYRIDQASLAAANIPLSSFAPENIQIFGRERELPIHVVDGNDSSFDPGDYILFYAAKNDGWLDSLKYRNSDFIANPGYSLVNDTIHYFFTWNNLTTNKRFVADPDIDFASYPPINFITREVSSPTSTLYSEGFKQEQASGSLYYPGEGYTCASAYAEASSVSVPLFIYTPNPYTGSDAILPEIDLNTVSAGSGVNCGGCPNHHLRLTIGPSDHLLIDTIYSGWQQQKITEVLPLNTINPGNTILNFNIIADLGAANDRQNFNYYKLKYSGLTNANGQNSDFFSIPYNSSYSKSRVDLTNYTGTSPLIFSFDGTPRLHAAVQTGSLCQFLVPNVPGGGANRVFISDPALAMNITDFRPVNNGSGHFTDFSQLSMESAYLIVMHKSLESATGQYAAYRSSMAGGSNNVVIADVNELYDQYGGGIPKDVMGVRRFALHAWRLSTVKPVGLLLAAKGVTEVGGTRFNQVQYNYSLIPTYGYPSSDIAITSGLEGTFWEPLIPTGRLSVSTGPELTDYLDKMVTYESQQGPSSSIPLNNEWQKEVLHFVGGSTTQQQQTFRYFMDGMANVIEDSLYAGNVTSYYKTSSDPLDPAIVEGVTDKIASGVSIMNFFSHAAASNNGFEINIDEPSNWNNTGKYPLVIGNSCQNGNIFAYGSGSTSEKFVKLPNEGAIGFISPVIVGYDVPLSQYSTQLYREISRNSYALPLGLQMKHTIQALQDTDDVTMQNAILESTCSQMILHGDPLLKVNWHSAPEISIKEESVYFTPSNIDLTVDTIDVNIVLTNLGQSVTDTFTVEITRNFPQSQVDSFYVIQLPGMNYKDTVVLRIPMQPSIGVGENIFSIRVDLPNMITEEFEEVTNNQLVKSLFIRVDGIQPIWPYDFAVVPIDSVTVKASTIDPISQSVRTYLFEMDTTHYYNSPQYRRFSTTGMGGIKQVDPSQWLNSSGSPFPLVCEDSMVYFWRVALDSSVLVWSEVSFQYIAGKQGWGQDHFFQSKKNDFYGLEYDMVNRVRSFPPPEAHYIDIHAYNSSTIWNRWTIDEDVDVGEYSCLFFGSEAIYVFVIDPVTMLPWETNYGTSNPELDFDNGNDNPDGPGGLCPTCHNRVEGYFAFEQNDPVQLAGFTNMIMNEIPTGFYVGIYTNPITDYTAWNSIYPGIYNAFGHIGSTQVSSGQPEMPVALFYREGDPSSLIEKTWADAIVGPQGMEVHIRDTIYQSEYTGLERTPFIGPSTDWQAIYWRRDSIENFPTDSLRIYIEAYDINRNLQATTDLLFTPNDSLLSLNSVIDAAQYPMMRLAVYNEDKQWLTPGQIERLHVLFQPVPEAALDGADTYYFSQDPNSFIEGQNAAFAIDIHNVSAWPMDSLLVKYWIEDHNHVKHYLPYERQDSLHVNDFLRDTISFSTVNYPGLNSLWVEVNPYVNGSVYETDQLEQFHFNNVLQLPFSVEDDDINPILDVTFNGTHILNADIINPKSEVIITLKDDNIYRIMDNAADTALFGIYLTDPQGIQKRIPFMDANGQTIMNWIPANSQNMKFRILWDADFEKDGTYTLFVQGTDRNGNVSGDMEYRISFEIVHESSITYMMNYPNPFSTSTRFVFTLTGSEPPDDMIIQIMTVTGRVIREITEAELGRIAIGRNISEYAWDGTDEFGDPLANGVYLYRVKAKLNGEDIKHRESSADNYFKKEFGKMYLMR